MPPIPALTSLRFFAALVVVLHHYQHALPYPRWLGAVAGQGQAGVACFFVLSGFVLTYNYQATFVAQGRAAAGAFYRARFARVYPLHLATLLAATPVTWLEHRAGLAAAWPLLAGSWVAHLLAVQAWLPLRPVIDLYNAPSWSISAEFAFYLAFPLLVVPLAAWHARPGRYVALIAALLAVEGTLAVTLAAAARALGEPWLEPHFTISAWVPVRIGEFAVGCALGALFLARAEGGRWTAWLADRRARDAALLAALATAYALCWLEPPAGALGPVIWALRHHVAFVPAFALMILALAAGPTFLSRPLAWPGLVLLGEASYALYMVHHLVQRSQYYVFQPTTPLGWLSGIAAALAIAVACHLWFERPARRWLRGGPQGVAA